MLILLIGAMFFQAFQFLARINALTLEPGVVLGSLSITAQGPVTLASSGATAGALRVGGDLLITAGAPVTQVGALLVSGDTTITAKSASSLSLSPDITLANLSNNFNGAVSLVGGNISIVDQGRLLLGPSSATGLFNATATGSIDQREDLASGITATGLATFTPGVGQSLLLDHSLNNFQRGIAVKGTAFADLTLFDRNRPIVLGDWSLTGNLAIQAKGITQSSSLKVAQKATLDGLSGDLILDRSRNDFQGPVSLFGQNVTLVDVNSINLGQSKIMGNLSVKSGGAISSSGALVVQGNALFDTTKTVNGVVTGYGIILSSPGNDFYAVGYKGSGVVVDDANGYILLPSSIVGAAAL